MSAENQTNTEILDQLKTELQELDTLYNGVYQTPEAILALKKTIQTFNITITDWNLLLSYVNSHGSSLDGIMEMIPDLVDALDNIQENLTLSISNKLPKESMSGFYAYTHDGAEQKQTPISEIVQGESLAIRDSNGRLQVAMPTGSTHATPKGYVDNFAYSLVASIDNSTYVLTITLKDKNNNTLGTPQTIDLPLESIVTSVTYYDTYTYIGITYNKVIVITLATTDVPTIVPVVDLVDGLVSTDQLSIILEDYATNIENGSGTNAVQEKMADATVNFVGRNPNAETLDPTISTTINTGASGNQSSAFGKNTMALAIASFACGNKTIAKGEESHAEGYQSVTLGDGSHAEGEQTTSKGSVSHSEGSNTVSKGNYSHAEGVRSVAEGGGSHAEGESTLAKSYAAHTEGFGCFTGKEEDMPDYPITPEPEPSPSPTPTPPTIQEGNVAHAEGNYCYAVGTGSHAEGYHTKALHEASHTEGVCTKSSNAGQHVGGYYNENNSEALFIIGNGTDEEHRANAFEILADGRAVIGHDPLNDNDVCNKKYVDEHAGETQLYKHEITIIRTGASTIYFELMMLIPTELNTLHLLRENVFNSSNGYLAIQALSLKVLRGYVYDGASLQAKELLKFYVNYFEDELQYQAYEDSSPTTINASNIVSITDIVTPL